MNFYMKYIHISARCSLQYRDERLNEKGLNGCQCTYILHICKNPGITQDMLARKIFINKSNVTRQLSDLEKNGFVIRKTSETDKRIIKVYPAQKALDVLPIVLSILQEWNNYITEDFSAEEKEILLQMLTRIADRARTYSENLSKENNLYE